MNNTKSSKRGKFKILVSQTMFLNDDEIGYIEFDYSGKASGTLEIHFEPMNNPPMHPPIEVIGSKSHKIVKLIGWNSPQVYSAISPMKLFKLVGPSTVYFSICNTYLGGTNMLHIEIYIAES